MWPGWLDPLTTWWYDWRQDECMTVNHQKLRCIQGNLVDFYLPVREATSTIPSLLQSETIHSRYTIPPENKADQSNVKVWCHDLCYIVIFDACHCPNLLLYTIHRNEVGASGAESEICCIVIDVLWLQYIYFWRTAIIFTFSLSCKGGRIVMTFSYLTNEISPQNKV